MKNLKPFSGDCFDVYKTAVGRKRSGPQKDILNSIKSTISSQYIVFDTNFNTNTLSSISHELLFDQHKDHLLSLYDYQCKAIREIRKDIEDQQLQTIRYICQNCSLDTASSMDHILPQSQFPEFAINGKNLFPCCTICNNYKNDAIEDGLGNDIFLNLFLDQLPTEQYLFINIFENNGLDFEFYLENHNNLINEHLYNRIVSHYQKLHLLYRMRNKAITVLTELENEISQFLEIINDIELARQFIIGKSNKDKLSYGHNYWKSILDISLVSSNLFMRKFSK